MAALVIFTLVMLTLMGALRVMAQGVTEMRARMDRTRLLCGVERVMRRDFNGALVTREKEPPACVGRNTQGESPIWEFFSTNSFAPEGKRPAVGVTRVEYYLKPTEGVERELALYRRETPWPAGSADDPVMKELERLAAGIRECRIAFHDGRQWVTAWRQNRLPNAVRLELFLKGDETAAQTMLFAPTVTPAGVEETKGK